MDNPLHPTIKTAGGGTVFLNPGTGPVAGATEADARANIDHFMADCGIAEYDVERLPAEDHGGRFGFRVTDGTRVHDLDMPGLPIDRVRWTDGLDPWEFPRLYLDGGSWLWKFAVNLAFRADDDEEDE